MTVATASRLAVGFADPVLGAQSTFRAALHALSYPGSIVEVGSGLQAPLPLQPAAAALALTLCDFETPVWLDPIAGTNAVRSFLRFHCGCSFVDRPNEASFAIVADAAAMAPLSEFNAGTDEAPDRSATVIIQVRRFVPGMGLRLSGPGIKGSNQVQIDGLTRSLVEQRHAAQADFPRGVDLLLVAGNSLLGLPRTTQLED